jgi:hypothetical protein
MASSVINSDDGVISGTSGLKSSGGDDGVLVFQSKGTETARINTDSQIVAAAGTASLPALTTTGDLNTGIFFSAADTIDFVEGGTACGQFDSSANFKFNSGYGSVATAYGCRAWVNFNGTNTVAIRASGNVSSITDNGTGDYTVNFTTAMPDANYSVSLMSDFNASGGFNANASDNSSTTSVVVYTYGIAGGGSGAYRDTDTVYVSIFR